jgi:hypothetical protein
MAVRFISRAAFSRLNRLSRKKRTFGRRGALAACRTQAGIATVFS